MTFTWDTRKAEENLKTHRVDFREAATVFDDALSTTFPDVDHSVGERRFLIIGMSATGRLLVSHTERGDVVRIISARSARKREQRFYEEDEDASS